MKEKGEKRRRKKLRGMQSLRFSHKKLHENLK